VSYCGTSRQREGRGVLQTFTAPGSSTLIHLVQWRAEVLWCLGRLVE